MRQEIRVLGKVSSTRIGYLEMREKDPTCLLWSSVDGHKKKWPSFVTGRLLGTKELQSEGKECLLMGESYRTSLEYSVAIDFF